MKPSSDIAAEYRNFAIWVPTTPGRNIHRAADLPAAIFASDNSDRGGGGI